MTKIICLIYFLCAKFKDVGKLWCTNREDACLPAFGTRLFCSDCCKCGTKKQPCTNVPGRPGSKLSQHLGIDVEIGMDEYNEGLETSVSTSSSSDFIGHIQQLSKGVVDYLPDTSRWLVKVGGVTCRNYLTKGIVQILAKVASAQTCAIE